MKNITTHEDQLPYLKKIEGQVRGIQRMIEQGEYCVDILTQVHSVIGALCRVEDQVLKKHLNGCVAGALAGASPAEKQKKLDEVTGLITRFRKV